MFKRAKLPIRKLFTDVCTIENSVFVKKEFGQTEQTWEVIATDEPCRISFSSFPQATDTDYGVAEIQQVIKLFIREDIEVKAGSRISITRNNQITIYRASGVPAIHSNHQEINLEIEQKYA